MCKMCKGSLKAYSLVTRKLRVDQLAFCDKCILELERYDLSYKSSGIPDAEVTFRQLRKSGFWV